MGDVYLAEDLKLRRMVAMKVLPADVVADPQRRTRFLQEAHAASVLSHPNVCTIHEVGEDGDNVFIIMEYIEGQTLSQVRESRTLNIDDVVDIALQAADALDEAKTRGVVHRDIKSANIMLTARGHVKVLDFGLAKVTAPDETSDETKVKTGVGIVVGTPYYMSPEQGHGQDLDVRSDLYSLGVIFYEMLTGKKPYLAATPMAVIYMHGNAPIPTLEGDLQQYQPILNRLLAKEPAQRFASAGELLDEIGRQRAEMK